MTHQFSAGRKLRAIARELEFRRAVYPRQVATGKMTASHAREQIAIMEAIRDDYAKLAERERLL